MPTSSPTCSREACGCAPAAGHPSAAPTRPPSRSRFVDAHDLGEAAAIVLADPTPHVGRGYTLTGPRAVTFTQVAALLTDTLGRPVRYEPATVLGYLRHVGRHGLPIPQRAVQTVLHVGLRRGDASQVDPTLARLLGRPARDIADYIADHARLFARPADAA